MLRSHHFVSATSDGAIKDKTCYSTIRRRADQGHNADHQERALDKSTTPPRREHFQKTNSIPDDRSHAARRERAVPACLRSHTRKADCERRTPPTGRKD